MSRLRSDPASTARVTGTQRRDRKGAPMPDLVRLSTTQIGRSERSNLGSCRRAISTCHKRRTRRRTSSVLPWDVDFATASAALHKVVASSSLFERLVLVPDDPADPSLDHSHLRSSRRPRARNRTSIHQAGRPEQFDLSAHLMPDLERRAEDRFYGRRDQPPWDLHPFGAGQTSRSGSGAIRSVDRRLVTCARGRLGGLGVGRCRRGA